MSALKPSENCYKFIQSFEGCHTKRADGKIASYKCPAGVWTIGWGSTIYPNGQKVGPNDVITPERALEIFKWHVGLFANDVNSLVTSTINQNQFDTLVSFAYNCGSDIDIDVIPEGLGDSTLLKQVNANPNDPKIKASLAAWNKGGGKVLPGLVRRREAEGKLYFTPVLDTTTIA
jgi:lysozyme